MKFMITGLLLFFSSVSFGKEASYSCALIDNAGTPQSVLNFSISPKDEKSMYIGFSHTNLFQDLFIHRKDNNEFVGAKVISGKVELTVYDIQENNPTYKVVSSKVSSSIYSSALLTQNQIFKDSPLKRYESSTIDALNVAVVNNQFVKDLVFSRTNLKYKMTFEDNKSSYVFVLDQWLEVEGKLSLDTDLSTALCLSIY